MVMGMLGAFGKMNRTSSNLLRRRQFSARKILHSISDCFEHGEPRLRTSQPRYPPNHELR